MRLLSIVMPALLHRMGDYSEDGTDIYEQLNKQIEDWNGQGGRTADVEFFCLLDNGPLSTGEKFSHLFDLCRGKYICAVGDDDKIEPDYVETLVKAIKEHDGVDVITFEHTYNVNGEFLALTKQVREGGCGDPGHVECMHPRNGASAEQFEIHYRLPGPLCPVRAEIARAFTHPHMSDREDAAYKDYLRGAAKTHHNIERVLYHHMWVGANKEERGRLKYKWGRK